MYPSRTEYGNETDRQSAPAAQLTTCKSLEMDTEEDFLLSFQTDLSDPLVYLEPSSRLEEYFLRGLRTVFGLCKGSRSLQTGPLPELYTEGFDNDQIWEEVQLLNEPALGQLRKVVHKVSGQAGRQCFLRPCVTTAEPSGHEGGELEDGSEGEGSRGESREDSEEDHSSVVGEGEEGEVRMKWTGKKSVVDDRFFKLSEMEHFLEQVEAGEGEERESGLFARA